MTRDEMKEVLIMMQATYPKWQPESLTATIDAWYALFRDYQKIAVDAALNTYIKTSDSAFAPSASQIMGIIRTANSKPLGVMTSQEAWDLVNRASQRALYYAEEEFEKLPPLVQKAVGSVANIREIAKMDSETVQGVEKSTFKRTYDMLVQRQEEYNKIPTSARTMIQNATQNLLEG